MVADSSANSQRPKQQRDTRPRNGLMVLMVLTVLKELLSVVAAGYGSCNN